ncbi:MAG: hypothetical protein FJ335_03720 [Sphingomonadales bacterium]|nr:hypothetical protein [Sphingomonadales bacterium]
MKGDVTFDAGRQRYTLFLGNAAQCALEEQHDKGFFAVVADALPSITPEDLADPAKLADAARIVRVASLRDLFWHGLRKHHADVTLDDVSDIADAIGQARFGELLGKAIAATQDRMAGEAGGAKPGKPRTPRRKPTG